MKGTIFALLLAGLVTSGVSAAAANHWITPKTIEPRYQDGFCLELVKVSNEHKSLRKRMRHCVNFAYGGSRFLGIGYDYFLTDFLDIGLNTALLTDSIWARVLFLKGHWSPYTGVGCTVILVDFGNEALEYLTIPVGVEYLSSHGLTLGCEVTYNFRLTADTPDNIPKLGLQYPGPFLFGVFVGYRFGFNYKLKFSHIEPTGKKNNIKGNFYRNRG